MVSWKGNSIWFTHAEINSIPVKINRASTYVSYIPIGMPFEYVKSKFMKLHTENCLFESIKIHLN